MTCFKSGAKSTSIKPRYDLIPIEALTYMAERFAKGLEYHGENNYKKGLNDKSFKTDRINHAIAHLQNYANNRPFEDDSVKDHLKAALCNLAILAWLEENSL